MGGGAGGRPTEAEDELQEIQRRYNEIDERRVKEWENFQRAQRSALDHATTAFFDIAIDGTNAGRLIVELFDDVVPQTVENFRCLVSGERPLPTTTPVTTSTATESAGSPVASGVVAAAPGSSVLSSSPSPSAVPSMGRLDYIDTAVHRIIKGHAVYLGELGGLSVPALEGGLQDESFAMRHAQRGVLSMVSRGPNTNGSSFCITLDKAPVLDFKQVVFGKIVDGITVLDKIEAVPLSKTGIPKQTISVAFCGVLTGRKPLGPRPVDVGALEPIDGAAE